MYPQQPGDPQPPRIPPTISDPAAGGVPQPGGPQPGFPPGPPPQGPPPGAPGLPPAPQQGQPGFQQYGPTPYRGQAQWPPTPGALSAPPASAPALVARRRSRLAIVLTVTSVLLGLALIVVTVVGLNTLVGLRHDSADLTSQKAERQRGYDEAAAALQKEFTLADLAGKLARIKELDKSADEKFQRWINVDGVKFGELSDVMQACNDVVIAYDQSAAAFPAEMLNGLPDQINLANPETDCGRAFTRKI